MNNFAFRPLQGGGSAALPTMGGDIVANQAAADTPVLTRYIRIGLRRKWLIIATVAAALLIGLIATLLMTPLYTATATIEISRETDNVVQIEGVKPESSSLDQEFYQTQYGLLRSRSLAEEVARSLNLAENPAFFEMFGETLDEAAQPNNGRIVAAERDRRIRLAADVLLDNLSIAPERLSRLVDISFTSPDPALSAEVVNAWTAHFIESNLQRRFEATSYARNFLEDRLEQLRQRLEESERQLVSFAANQRIINVSSPPAAGAAPTAERSLVADDLTALNAELSRATADRISAQSRLDGRSSGAVSESLQNLAISNLRAKRAEVAAEYAQALVQFEPEHPQAQELASQLEQLDRSINQEEARVGRTLQSNYENALARERTLERRVEALKDDLLDVRRRSIQYTIYQREVDTNRELYNGLLQRYKEIGVAGGVGTNNIAIVDPALTPQRPSSPRLLLNLLLALLTGMIVGIGLAVAAEQIDETIADPTALADALNLPLLGTIPKTDEASPLEALRDRKSALVDAYLSVQTSLGFSTEHGVPRSLSVTSTNPAEGKSTTAFAIAVALGRAKRRVILVDGDMRSPSLHGMVDIPNEAGLSNYLAGQDDVTGMIQRLDSWGIDALTAGPPPPNAGELLTGDRVAKLLTTLEQHYDHVVIDSPPVLGLADAPLIASRVEGTVFAVESHRTRTGQLKVALSRLFGSNARLLGAILTKFEAAKARSAYGYDYGYGYGREQEAG